MLRVELDDHCKATTYVHTYVHTMQIKEMLLISETLATSVCSWPLVHGMRIRYHLPGNDDSPTSPTRGDLLTGSVMWLLTSLTTPAVLWMAHGPWHGCTYPFTFVLLAMGLICDA